MVFAMKSNFFSLTQGFSLVWEHILECSRFNGFSEMQKPLKRLRSLCPAGHRAEARC